MRTPQAPNYMLRQRRTESVWEDVSNKYNNFEDQEDGQVNLIWFDSTLILSGKIPATTGYWPGKCQCKSSGWFLCLQEWFTVLENYHRLTATVSDLIMGNSYAFRVFSQNRVGTSESCAVTKEVATILKTGEAPLSPPCHPWVSIFTYDSI